MSATKYAGQHQLEKTSARAIYIYIVITNFVIKGNYKKYHLNSLHEA